MTKLDEVQGGPDYSSALGTAVEGERMIVGLMRMAAGTGSDPHSHPNEQWIYVLEGTLEMEVGGKMQTRGAGHRRVCSRQRHASCHRARGQGRRFLHREGHVLGSAGRQGGGPKS